MPTLAAIRLKMFGVSGSGGCCGGYFALVAETFSTADQAALLNDAVAEGMRFAGLPMADPMAPTDAEVGATTVALLPRLLDVTEFKILEAMANAQAARPTTDGYADRQKQGDAGALLKAKDAKLAMIQSLYGYGLGIPRAGVGGMAAGAPMPNDPFNPWSRTPRYSWPYPP